MLYKTYLVSNVLYFLHMLPSNAATTTVCVIWILHWFLSGKLKGTASSGHLTEKCLHEIQCVLCTNYITYIQVQYIKLNSCRLIFGYEHDLQSGGECFWHCCNLVIVNICSNTKLAADRYFRNKLFLLYGMYREIKHMLMCYWDYTLNHYVSIPLKLYYAFIILRNVLKIKTALTIEL